MTGSGQALVALRGVCSIGMATLSPPLLDALDHLCHQVHGVTRLEWRVG